MARVLLLILSAALALSAAEPLNMTGAWKLNYKKTVWHDSNPPANMTWQVKQDGAKLSILGTFTNNDGSEGRESYVFDTSGKETVNTNGEVELRTILNYEGDILKEDTKVLLPNGMTIPRISSTTVSSDGKTMTQVVEMKPPDGSVIKRTLVLDKQ